MTFVALQEVDDFTPLNVDAEGNPELDGDGNPIAPPIQEPTTKVPEEDDDIPPTAEELAAEAAKKKEEDAAAAADPNDEPGDGLDPRKETDDEPEVTNGVEEFLSQFNIVGGMIDIEDEEGNPVQKHFNDLTEVEKLNVLKSVSGLQAQSIEAKHDLTQNEIDLLNESRTAQMDINDFIEQKAKERADQLVALSESGEADLSKMSDDAIFMKFLKDSDPEATEEDIAEELSNAKNGKLFSKNVDRIRDQYRVSQEDARVAAEKVRRDEALADLEIERKEIVKDVVGIDSIADWSISDDDKNHVLSKMLEVNDKGDPVFMEEVFSSPKTFFKAAWLYYNSEEKFEQMASYYKKEISKARNKGFEEARSGMSSKPISGSGPSSTKKDDDKVVPMQDPVDYISMDDMFDD